MGMFFSDAAEKLNIDPDLLKVYRQCDASIKINIPIVRQDKRVESITAFRS